MREINKDICNLVPPKGYANGISYYHFVYETEYQRLHQPFLRPCYYMYLIVKGSGTLKVMNKTYPLEVGTIFVTAPYLSHEIEGSDIFTYLYISFDGECVPQLLKSYQIQDRLHIANGYACVIEFWMDSIRRFSTQNANALTESVLMYTLSHIVSNQANIQSTSPDKFQIIIDFLQNHLQNKDLSLKNVADLFFYNEKYFSALFKQNMGINFSQYLNEIRIQHAVDLIRKNDISVAEVAFTCGFSDSMYFSKVFKRIIGKTPSEYKKQYESKIANS